MRKFKCDFRNLKSLDHDTFCDEEVLYEPLNNSVVIIFLLNIFYKSLYLHVQTSADDYFIKSKL